MKMNRYIATFFSHYGALAFFSALKERGIEAKLMPVPRKVSAACGTCVCYTAGVAADIPAHEMEAVYVETPGGYSEVQNPCS